MIPRGPGRGGLSSCTAGEMGKLLVGGAGYAVACGHGMQRDLDRCEDRGVTGDADLAQVSEATRALPPAIPICPPTCARPGSRCASYVLAGVPGGAFGSACHSAGRRMSRHQAARSVTGPELRRRIERQGIAVRGASARGLAEETPEAYKDIDQVIRAAEGAGLCRNVARLVPLGVIKG